MSVDDIRDSLKNARDVTGGRKGRGRRRRKARSGRAFGVQPPFVADAEGLWHVVPGKREGDERRTRLADRFHVVYETFDPEQERHGLLLAWQDRRGADRTMHLARGELIAPGALWMRALMNGGCNIEVDRKAQNYLAEFLASYEAEEEAFVSSRCGWFDVPTGEGVPPARVFLLPDAAIGAEKTDPVLFDGRATDAAAPAVGTLKEWNSFVGDLVREHARGVFVVGLALAAPLLHLVGEESGGFHLRGPSSVGKSVLLCVAASVWGNEPHSWRSTVNGAEALATASCDMLLALDELGQADPEEAGELAYLLANGKGKSRMGQDRRIEYAGTWRLLFLSTGEVSLPHLMSTARRRVQAGQEIRFIDIAADAGAGLGVFDVLPEGFANAAELAEHLRAAATRYRGTLGRAFVKSLVASPDAAALAQRIEFHRRAWCEDYVDRDARKGVARDGLEAPDGQVRRAGQRFALVYAALALAIERGLLPWTRVRAQTAVAACWHDWLDARGGVGSGELTAVKERLRAFIAQNHHRFVQLETSAQLDQNDDVKLGETRWTTQNAAGLFRPGGYGTKAVYLFNGPTWRTEIMAGTDSRLINRALIEAGILIPGDGKRPTCQVKVRGVNARYFKIDPDQLGASEPGDD